MPLWVTDNGIYNACQFCERYVNVFISICCDNFPFHNAIQCVHTAEGQCIYVFLFFVLNRLSTLWIKVEYESYIFSQFYSRSFFFDLISKFPFAHQNEFPRCSISQYHLQFSDTQNISHSVWISFESLSSYTFDVSNPLENISTCVYSILVFIRYILVSIRTLAQYWNVWWHRSRHTKRETFHVLQRVNVCWEYESV